MEFPYTTKEKALKALGRRVQDLIEEGYLVHTEQCGGTRNYDEKTICLTVLRPNGTVKGSWNGTHYYSWF